MQEWGLVGQAVALYHTIGAGATSKRHCPLLALTGS